MERFIEQHKDHIAGVLSGYDRILFRGTLRSISYINGLDIFLSSHHVLYKNFSKFAEGLTQEIKKHAESFAARAGRPFQYVASPKAMKQDIARQIMEQDRIENGLICVLSCVEPCQTFEIQKNRSSKTLKLVSRERKCTHLYFYYVDREFGFMHIRLQTWLPFAIQVCVNGHEWLARRLDAAGIAYQRYENCFTSIENLSQAQEIFNHLIEREWVPLLNALAQRVNPLIAPPNKLDLHGYYWIIREDEFATDVMFTDPDYLKEHYPRLVHYAIQYLGARDILRFLQRRTGYRFRGEVKCLLGRRPEGLRVKHWVEENSIKMYDKGGIVLRIETTINNPRRFKILRQTTRKGIHGLHWVPMCKGVAAIARRAELQRAANERYLEALAVVEEPAPTALTLDPVSKRKTCKGRPYRALRPIAPDEAECFQAILEMSVKFRGMTNADLRNRLMPEKQADPQQRRKASAKVSRLLRLLRSHGLIAKVSRTHTYRLTKKGNHVMTTALRIRNLDVRKIAA